MFPSLGVLKVGAAFKAQGVEVDVLDLSSIINWQEVLVEYFIDNKNIDFIGLTAATPQCPEAFKIATFLDDLIPFTKLVLGGSHATAMNAAYKMEQKRGIKNGRAGAALQKLLNSFDVLVCGDGELTLHKILNTERGIIDADNKKSEFFITDQQFTDLPLPDRSLIDLKSYHYMIDGYEATSLIAQLGCPYGCGFCCLRFSPSMRLIRSRTVESVVQEIKDLYLVYGYTGFMLFDDELNVNRNMIQLMNSLSDLQMGLGVDFKFRGFLKSELTTEEQLIAMKDAGFTWLLCGFESANERILENIQKRATIEDNTRFIEMAKKYSMRTKALISFGHPAESFKTIEDTKNWLISMEVDDFDATIITTLGGSPYYDLADKISEDTYVYIQPKTGDKLYQKNLDYTVQADYYKGHLEEYRAYVWTDHLTSEELVTLRDEVESTVRSKLNIPYNQARPGISYEHSMGMGLPDNILRSTKHNKKKG